METIEKDIKRLSKLQLHCIGYYLLVILLIIVEPLVVITGGSLVTLLELIPNNQLNDVF